MQFMLTAFGRVLHFSIGLDNTSEDPQLVCLSSGDFERADDKEGEEAKLGFGFCKP